MRRGFVLTLDVMVALIVAAVLISAIMYFVSYPKLKTDEYLYLVGSDFLSVADHQGLLVDAAQGDSAGLEDFIDEMPDNLCLNVTIWDQGSLRVVRDNGCPAPQKYVLAKRSATNGTYSYVCEAGAWYR